MPSTEDKILNSIGLIKNYLSEKTTVSANRDDFVRITTKELCIFSRQLATLLRAGMPLAPALSALVEQLGDEPFAKIVEQIAEDVNAGSSLADALKKHPAVFSSLFVNMVITGEISSTLEDVLLRLADMLEKRTNLNAKVKSAIAYPLMMVVVATGVVIFLLSFVVPQITEVFLEMNRTLPWPTKLLISISDFTKQYLLLIVIIICVAAYGIRCWFCTVRGRFFIDRSILGVPVFGKFFLKLEITRLTRILGVLITSGIGVLEALKIVKGVVQNKFIAQAVDSIQDTVQRGSSVAAAIKKTGVFPPIMYHIVNTGQIGGNLEAAFIDIADMYDNEIERQSKTLISLLEPAIFLVMGVIVAFIVMAVLLPIFEINQAF